MTAEFRKIVHEPCNGGWRWMVMLGFIKRVACEHACARGGKTQNPGCMGSSIFFRGGGLALYYVIMGYRAVIQAHHPIHERQQVVVVRDDDEGAVVRYLLDHTNHLRAAALIK